MWWYRRGKSGGSWLMEEKKANMWPEKGNSGGSWPPAYPALNTSVDSLISYIHKFKQYIDWWCICCVLCVLWILPIIRLNLQHAVRGVYLWIPQIKQLFYSLEYLMKFLKILTILLGYFYCLGITKMWSTIFLPTK